MRRVLLILLVFVSFAFAANDTTDDVAVVMRRMRRQCLARVRVLHKSVFPRACKPASNLASLPHPAFPAAHRPAMSSVHSNKFLDHPTHSFSNFNCPTAQIVNRPVNELAPLRYTVPVAMPSSPCNRCEQQCGQSCITSSCRSQCTNQCSTRSSSVSLITMQFLSATMRLAMLHTNVHPTVHAHLCTVLPEQQPVHLGLPQLLFFINTLVDVSLQSSMSSKFAKLNPSLWASFQSSCPTPSPVYSPSIPQSLSSPCTFCQQQCVSQCSSPSCIQQCMPACGSVCESSSEYSNTSCANTCSSCTTQPLTSACIQSCPTSCTPPPEVVHNVRVSPCEKCQKQCASKCSTTLCILACMPTCTEQCQTNSILLATHSHLGNNVSYHSMHSMPAIVCFSMHNSIMH
ncbi:hypothetical protein PRIPAC_82435 [Pristionchus pacificus]|nr:hypothetical protein PRIPAC_82435 [Pristionchus pacificus]